MPEEALLDTYYKNKNGEWDSNVSCITGCYNVCKYLAVRNKLKEYKDPWKIFLDDISVGVSEYKDRDYFVELVTVNSKGDKLNDPDNILLPNTNCEVIVEQDYKARGTEAVALIEALLNKGEIVSIMTCCELLKFSFKYDPGFLVDGFRPGHCFIIVWQDENNFYYVDNSKYALNPDNFTPYKENCEIGIAEKKDFIDAFNIYFQCFTYDINYEKLILFDNNIDTVLSKLIKNYYKDTERDTNRTIYYGRQAIIKFQQMCNEETDIEFKSRHYPLMSFHEVLLWRFFHIGTKRNLLGKYLYTYRKKYSKDIILNLFLDINKSMKIWFTIRSILQQNAKQNIYVLNSVMGDHFKEILEIEDRFFENLSKIISI